MKICYYVICVKNLNINKNLKDIEDDQVPDEEVIQHLEARIEMSSPSPLQTKRLLRTSYTGYDNFTLLHYAVKNFRPKLSQFLIDTIEIGCHITLYLLTT